MLRMSMPASPVSISACVVGVPRLCDMQFCQLPDYEEASTGLYALPPDWQK